MKSSIAAIAVSCTIVGAQTGYDTFFPLQLNSTAYITNTSAGTYGGVYTAGTTDTSYPSPPTTYDYCHMPHPRTDTYKLPGPVANGSVKADIIFLEYVQRHQRRTAYNILPGGENVAYQCNNVRPYLYAGPGDNISAQAPIPMYAQTYTDPTNPFVKSYVSGTCQYPQITIGGLLDGYVHGTDIAGVYKHKLRLIPDSPNRDVYFRSSESALTQDSAGGVLRGVWPDYHGALPLHQQASSVDTVNGGYSCSLKGALQSDAQSTALWKSHLNVTAPLLASLSNYTQNSSAWTSTFDHLNDNFQARLCNGYGLPCNVNDTSNCVTTAQADEVFRAGDWEWNYYWREYANASLYITVTEGHFIGEMIARWQAVLNGTSSLKYSHTFVHDGDVGPIAGALGINVLRWPAMASNIAFELWKTERSGNGYGSSPGGQVYARVLYSGQPIPTIHGTLDWIPVSQLLSILQPYVPANIATLCAQSL